MALALTGFAFIQAIRQLRLGPTESGWFLVVPLLHGWLLLAMNILIYLYFCWLAFWLIRGTAGRERLFMVGWFVGILLRPLKILGPQWAMATKHIGAFGLAVALLAVVALLLEPPVVRESGGPN